VVFSEAVGGGADGAEDVVMDIAFAADKIVEGVGEGVEEEAIAGEIASAGIFFGGGEADGVGMSAIGVVAIGAEGGDFDLLAVAADEHDAEGEADLLAVGEKAEYLVGRGGGGDIVIFGGVAHEMIADAAAGEIGGVSGVAEGFEDGECGILCICGKSHKSILSKILGERMEGVLEEIWILRMD
jgi:hypothetical protein